MTYDELVLKHNELAAYCEAEDAAHVERLKPFREGIKTILDALLAKLQSDKLKNAKTPHGLVYLYNSASVKVNDKNAFMDFIVSQKRFDLLDARAMKKPVQEYITQNEVAPPGLDIKPNVVARIRDKQTETEE